jgi:copper chaperone
MNTVQFKTNINCSGCVAKVTGPLNAVAGKENWQVDTAHPQKILTVQPGTATEQDIVAAVQKTGFTAEKIQALN